LTPATYPDPTAAADRGGAPTPDAEPAAAIPAAPAASHEEEPAGVPTGETARPSRLARLDEADRRVSRRVAVVWPHPAWFTRPLGLLSRSANHGILWYGLSLLPWLAGHARPLAAYLYVAVPVTLVEVLGFGIKSVVRRRRPTVADPDLPEQIRRPITPSFPSSHASMAVVGTMTMGAMYPAWVPALLVLTAVLCFSRVYLGVHYLGDVAGGLVWGLLFGIATLWLVGPPL
jgi:membrane-associated phospholipid phosphatase